ncbi:MAG TPA: SRPBCC domain-containing protein [Micromonospora sp.]
MSTGWCSPCIPAPPPARATNPNCPDPTTDDHHHQRDRLEAPTKGHHFELSKDLELNATPEQVWEAIATGPGIDSWFMGRSEVEPREGGRTSLSLAGPVEEATVTAWEPGKRFASRTEPGPDGTFMAFEYLIEGRDQGSTVLRLVQSGVLGDNWETEYEAMQVGWNMYLETLAAYLTHFAGRTGAPVTAFRPGVGGEEKVWAAVTDALGISGPVAEGQPARFTVDGLPPVEGVVDLAALPTYLGVRTTDGLYRFLYSGSERGDALVLGHHIFAVDQDPARVEQGWQNWLTALPVG